jgi:hypothetical protein
MFGDHNMDLQAIEIAPLAGLIASPIFASVASRTADAVIVTRGHRVDIQNIDRFAIQVLPGLA